MTSLKSRKKSCHAESQLVNDNEEYSDKILSNEDKTEEYSEKTTLLKK